MRSETALGNTPFSRATDGRKTPNWVRRTRLVSAILLASIGGIHGWASQPPQAKTERQTQNETEAITGVVMDPSGAVVRGASVTLMSSEDPTAELNGTTTGELGRYRLEAGTGTYIVVVEAPGFAPFESGPIRVEDVGGDARATRSVDIRLKVATRVDKIDVPDESMGGSNSNGSTTVLSRQDIEHMPLDPAALLSELQGIAGGPDAQLFVGGFSGNKLPPRASISQIRIKQNPYSAENDTDPGTGTIQVSTRAGTDQLHGELYLYGDASAMNAQNPFAPDEPGYYAYGTGGSVTGSLNKKASYFAGWDQLQLAMNSAVDAQALDDNLNPILVSYAVRSPRSTISASSRLDLQPGTNSAVMVRYTFDRFAQTNGGIGQLALESQGFSNTTVAQTLQISNTQLIGTKIVNETRFQYIHARAEQTPASTDPTILVEGAFLGGGNDQGAFSDHQDRYELQNYVSLAEGRHYLNFGGRLRVARDANYSLANFNGEFIFSSMSAYQAMAQGMAAKKSYAEIDSEGGGASEFSLNAGSPNAVATVVDAGLFRSGRLEGEAKPDAELRLALRDPERYCGSCRLGTAGRVLVGLRQASEGRNESRAKLHASRWRGRVLSPVYDGFRVAGAEAKWTDATGVRGGVT